MAATQTALATFAHTATATDLGPSARIRVREHLKDCLGVALAANTQEPAVIIDTVLQSAAQREDGCQVIGAGYRVAPWDAAWANGSRCHLLDYDDYGHGHPSACIVPAALAAGELRPVSGTEFMVALAIGWDVFERLSSACRKQERLMRHKGIHPTAIYGGPAAAATAGRLLGLSRSQLNMAIGLAASASSGLTEHFGTWGKGVQAGNAARAGVMAAMLARQGYSGARTAIEGAHGLLSVFAGADNFDLDGLQSQQGLWAIENPGVSIKRYPACGGTMRGIDAALELRNDYVDDPLSIERIDVELSESMLHSLHIDRPKQGFEGKFSIRFCVASAFADGVVTVDSFSDENLSRPIIQRLMDRTTVHTRPGGFVPGPDTYRTPVTVYLAGGAIATREVAEPRGNTTNRMTYEEITAKFLDCGRHIEQASLLRLNDAIDNLDCTDVTELMDVLANLHMARDVA